MIWTTAHDHPVATVTSGKWGDDFATLRFVDGGQGSLAAKVEAYMDQITYGEVGADTAKANARLIAAAPALYAALKSLVQANEDWNRAVMNVIGRPIGWSDEYLSAARDAIALVDHQSDRAASAAVSEADGPHA